MTTEREDAELRDARISASYRELAREEPSARVDTAILDAARARVRRPRARRWTVPVSLAAVLVLSVLVTTRIHEQAPDMVSGVPTPAEPTAKVPAARKAEEAQRPLQRPEAKLEPGEPRADAAPAAAEKRESVPFVAPRAARAPPAGAQAPRLAGRSAAGSLVEPKAARESAALAAFEESPQEWLNHIARLRDEGRDAEADTSLERFRRRYPDFRIPEAMRTKVMPR